MWLLQRTELSTSPNKKKGPSPLKPKQMCFFLQTRPSPHVSPGGFLVDRFLNFVLKSLGHGQKIAVVQNEFGAVPVDDQLMLLERLQRFERFANSSKSPGNSWAKKVKLKKPRNL